MGVNRLDRVHLGRILESLSSSAADTRGSYLPGDEITPDPRRRHPFEDQRVFRGCAGRGRIWKGIDPEQ